MMETNASLDLFPRQAGCWVGLKIDPPPFELGELPAMNGNILGLGREIIPKILDELPFMHRVEFEGWDFVHGFTFTKPHRSKWLRPNRLARRKDWPRMTRICADEFFSYPR